MTTQTLQRLLSLIFIFGSFTLLSAQDDFWQKVELPIVNPYQDNGALYGHSGVTYHEIAVNSRGAILVAKGFQSSPNGFGPDNSIYLRSLDNGNSWENITESIPQLSSNNPALANSNWVAVDLVAVDTTFYVLLKEREYGHREHSLNRIVYSEDDGRSWEFAPINDIDDEVALLSDESGGLLLYFSSDNSVFRNHTGYVAFENPWVQLYQADARLENIVKLYEDELVPDLSFGFGEPPSYTYPIMINEGGANYAVDGIQEATSNVIIGDNNFYFKQEPYKQLLSVDHSPIEFTPDEPANDFDDGINFTQLFKVFRAVGDRNLYTATNGGAGGDLMVSADAGAYWKATSPGVFRSINRLYPVSCPGQIFLSGYRFDQPQPSPVVQSRENFVPNTHRSLDGGKTWELLTGLTSEIHDWEYAEDGRIFVGTFDGLFMSREESCDGSADSNQKEYVFGTTVITPGIQFELDATAGVDTWAEELAIAIIEKSASGRIFKYDPYTGKLELMLQAGPAGEGEDVVIFNWIEETLYPFHGVTEAAADALFTALVLAQQEGQIQLKDLHFIGHGRACVVNSLAVERLLTVESESSISVAQVTNLGPYDNLLDAFAAGIPFSESIGMGCLNDARPDLDIYFPEYNQPNNGVINWEGVYSDTYWQDNGKLYVQSIVVVLTELIKSHLKSMLEDRITNLATSMEERILSEDIKRIMDLAGPPLEEKLDRIIRRMKESSVRIGGLKGLWKIKSRIGLLSLVLSTASELSTSNLEERPVSGTKNYHWQSYEGKEVVHFDFVNRTFLPDSWVGNYIGVCHAYIESVRKASPGLYDEQTGGYSVSRLNGYLHQSRNTGGTVVDFDFFRSLDLAPTKNGGEARIRGLVNGSFDRTFELLGWEAAPGWEYHGGLIDDEVDFENNAAKFLYDGDAQDRDTLQHNRCYVPRNARSLRFKYKKEIGFNHALTVEVRSVRSGQSNEVYLPMPVEVAEWQEGTLDLTGFQAEVVTLIFSFGGDSTITHELNPASPAVGWLDEVSWSREPAIAINSTFTENQSSTTAVVPGNGVDNSSTTQSISINEREYHPAQVADLTQWEISGGELGDRGNAISIRPQKKREIVSFTSPAFMTTTSTELSLKVNYSRITKGIFSIYLLDVDNGEEMDLFQETFDRDFLDRMSADTEVLETESSPLSLSTFQHFFETLEFDLSSYRNRKLRLKVAFLPMGSNRPKVYLEDVQIN